MFGVSVDNYWGIFLSSWVDEVSCLMAQHSASGEKRTSDPSISRLKLYQMSHCGKSNFQINSYADVETVS